MLCLLSLRARSAARSFASRCLPPRGDGANSQMHFLYWARHASRRRYFADSPAKHLCVEGGKWRAARPSEPTFSTTHAPLRLRPPPPLWICQSTADAGTHIFTSLLTSTLSSRIVMAVPLTHSPAADALVAPQQTATDATPPASDVEPSTARSSRAMTIAGFGEPKESSFLDCDQDLQNLRYDVDRPYSSALLESGESSVIADTPRPLATGLQLSMIARRSNRQLRELGHYRPISVGGAYWSSSVWHSSLSEWDFSWQHFLTF